LIKLLPTSDFLFGTVADPGGSPVGPDPLLFSSLLYGADSS